ncbi:MAG TPA: hypothetical protein IAB06_05075 [Candidatus Avacidaminococcus intestinavium]|uniref:Uncharacterized protein n=1 Tax=Candidatus Avacidaminococcus intestinavium TaxID=2840684 RepID=A0A9D1SLJ9_9FIRM|nr:hypothetical protein [Candidatus Avacidaminococcus intestinavium]
MKIDKEAFDAGLKSIRDCVQKFALALAEMEQEDKTKVLEASEWFYTNLYNKLLPLREELKNKVVFCIDEKDYAGIDDLLVCLQELDDVEKLIIGLKKDAQQ